MMKKVWFFLLVFVAIGSNYAFGQCQTDEFLDNCASRLETFTFIKAFNSNMAKAGTEEFSYVFSKGSNYLIIVCDQSKAGERLIVSLYDRNHTLIASSYNSKTKTYYPDILYPCTATGVYYLEAKLEGAKGGCGVTILGFMKSE
jgi:hypothetical protein